MQSKNNLVIDSYGHIAKFLHWMIALFIITNYILGLTLDTTEFKFITIHKQLGLTILLLVLLRILWRICNTYPNMASELSLFEKFAAKSGHIVLYVLMLAIPIFGVLMVQAKGYPLQFWGLFSIPTFISPQSHDISHQLKLVHEYLAHIIIIFAVLHALFALYHHFVNKDSILLRMLPCCKCKSKQ